jgi:lipid-A-disaccharide synthase
MRERRILVVAGEASGEMYGARLVRSIRSLSDRPVTFFGCAGRAMREAGVEPIATVEEVSVHGIVEVLSHLKVLFGAFRRLIAAARRRRPDLVILIDFPDFNIRLARRLRPLGVKIVYFISPQFWAWRRGRLRVLRELIDEMICILPFEESVYRNAGMAAEYVGHPLVEMLEVKMTREDFFSQFQLDAARPLVALLPGSRGNEILNNLPCLLATVARVRSHRPEIQFAVGVSSAVGSSFILRSIERWQRSTLQRLELKLIEEHTHSVLKYSTAAVVSSGTATLEAALLGTPLVCVYRVAPLSWWIGQKLVDVDYYCLVNLILDRPVVTELYQSDFSPKRLEDEILRLLDDPMARRSMVEEFTGLRQVLKATQSPTERAAQIVWSHLETPTPKNESKQRQADLAKHWSGIFV